MWIQRDSNPTELIQMICYKECDDPVFSADQLAIMVPSWRNVTGGGCITDIQAIHHICQFISPLLSASSIPANIRWIDSSSAFVSMYMHSNIENKLHAGMLPGSKQFYKFNQICKISVQLEEDQAFGHKTI